MNGLILAATLILLVLAGLAARRLRQWNRNLWSALENMRDEGRRRQAEALDRERDCWRSAARAITGGCRVRFHSQYGEDWLLMNLFEWRGSGCYVEIGAFDGVSLSNSVAFADIGWSGVLVEANPVMAEACARNRPESTTVHAAVGGLGGSDRIDFHRVVGGNTEVLSFTVASEEHLQRCEREGGRIETVSVPLKKIGTILAECALREPIDFMSIDIEGGEVAALEGMDWERYAPRAFVVENNDNRSRVRALLEPRGYALWRTTECNDIYVLGKLIASSAE